MLAWVETDPPIATTRFSQIDNYLRDAKSAIRERLEGDPGDPLTGIFETNSFALAPMPRAGSARAYHDDAADILALGATFRQDGRLGISTDVGPRLYHVAAAAVTEFAYLNLDGTRPMTGVLSLEPTIPILADQRTLVITPTFPSAVSGYIAILIESLAGSGSTDTGTAIYATDGLARFWNLTVANKVIGVVRFDGNDATDMALRGLGSDPGIYFNSGVHVGDGAGATWFTIASSAVADNIYMKVYDFSAGALVQVSRGASGSGGAGFRLLRVPN